MAFSDEQAKALGAKLSPKHVKTREVNGARLHYIEGWHAIAEANRIFGYDAWDRTTLSATCVWSGMHREHHACVYTAKVRITVRAGSAYITREGSGTGEGKGVTAGEAHDMALKTAETDATKRALATFGNPFGLALYDKELKGVRGTSRIRGGPSQKAEDKRWPLRSKAGAQGQLFQTPAAFAEGLRQALAQANDIEELFAIWEQNVETVRAASRLPNPGSTPKDVVGKRLVGHFKARAIALARGRERPASRAAKINGSDQSALNNFSQGERVDKSALSIGEPKRKRSKEHLRYVAEQACLVCGRNPAQAHHIRYAQPRAMARKVSDEFAVPLCAIHHTEVHHAGDEKAWWKEKSIEPLRVAERLWKGRPHAI